jgi:hypothetical protein
VSGQAVAALAYAAAGLHVFPVRPGGKVPALPAAHRDGDPVQGRCRGGCGRAGHGLYDATRDRAVIRAWWAADPRRNVGVACGQSGLFVVDLDGAEGVESWRELVARHGAPRTLAAHTPSGGLHLWYAARLDRPLGNSASTLAPHVDTRGVGGYVVAAPSVRPQGAYRWAGTPHVGQLPPVPEWVVAALAPTPPARRPAGGWRGPETADRALAGICRKVAGKRQPGRNETLYWAACAVGEHVAAGRMERSAGEAALMDAARACGLVDDDGERQCAATIAGGIRKGLGATAVGAGR